MEEAPLLEPAPQHLHLVVRVVDVAVAPHKEVKHVPQLATGECYDPLPLGHRQRGALADGGEEVGEGRGTGVPVAAAIVMQSSNR